MGRLEPLSEVDTDLTQGLEVVLDGIRDKGRAAAVTINEPAELPPWLEDGDARLTSIERDFSDWRQMKALTTEEQQMGSRASLPASRLQWSAPAEPLAPDWKSGLEQGALLAPWVA